MTQSYPIQKQIIQESEIANRIQNSDESRQSVSGGSSDHLDIEETIDIQVSSIDSLIRYTLSVLIGFISSVLTLIIIFINVSIENRNEDDRDWLRMATSIDSLINICCVYILFQFCYKFYGKFCQCCDRFAKSYFIKRIIQDNADQKDLTTPKQFESLLVTPTQGL